MPDPDVDQGNHSNTGANSELRNRFRPYLVTFSDPDQDIFKYRGETRLPDQIITESGYSVRSGLRPREPFEYRVDLGVTDPDLTGSG